MICLFPDEWFCVFLKKNTLQVSNLSLFYSCLCTWSVRGLVLVCYFMSSVQRVSGLLERMRMESLPSLSVRMLTVADLGDGPPPT